MGKSLIDLKIQQNTLITFDSFIDSILMIICRYCSNIDGVSSDIPSSYNMTRRAITTGLEATPWFPAFNSVRTPYVMAFSYDLAFNAHMNAVKLDTIRTHLVALLQSNNFTLDSTKFKDTVISSNVLLELVMLGLYFIASHVKRIYLPLTNSVVWFYDSTIITIATIPISYTADNIIDTYNKFLALLINGTLDENTRNLFKSVLYRIKYYPISVYSWGVTGNPNFANNTVCGVEALVNLT